MRDPMHMTLLESLEKAALRSDRGITVLDSKYQPHFQSYAQVVERAKAIAAGLQARGLKRGERVGLILSSPGDFIPNFFGVQYAGGVAIPMYGPASLARVDGYLETAGHILTLSQARFLVTEGKLVAASEPLVERVATLEGILDLEEVPQTASLYKGLIIAQEDVAFLQFTSGSTSKPKGVRLSHGCLQANVQAIRRFGVGLNPDDIAISWLPLYHDMGLIGFMFTPMVEGISITYMTPVQFIMRPKMWLKLMSELKGTISFSPNFGYGYAAKRIKDQDLEGLDLSNWRIAGCGAEPIKEETLNTFFERFEPVGFNPRNLVPCYGLAEFSLAATFTPMSRGIVTDSVDPEALASQRKAIPVPKGEGVSFVGCGFPVPGHKVEIVDSKGQVLPDRHVGEIRLSGPSRSLGYYGIPEGQGAFRDGYLYTGDLGYFASFELFVCGRDKEIIKSRGRTYYPQDIEWAAGQVEGVKFGTVAAFGVPGKEGTEEIIVVIERAKGTDLQDRKLKRAVKMGVGDIAGILVDKVIIGPKGTITKTSSGKVQRTKVRQAYLTGSLGEGTGKGTVSDEWSKLHSAENRD